MILYEYPFNERIRTLLRLEDLFDRLVYFATREHPYDHHAALVTLFEILEVASRADLKSDLLQELERQRQVLGGFRNSPAVSSDALDAILADIELVSRQLNESPGKTGQYLRDNEWLMSIRSRLIIPGGACEFDLPSYYAWQQRSGEERRTDLEQWLLPLMPLRHSLAIVLKLLRESASRAQVVAVSGSYQQMLTGRTYQMLQARVDPDLGVVPEISANKYMLWVRFSQTGSGELKPKTVDGEVPFEIALCNL
ncbi:MAG TPA: cell division protein ZapD [Burkholderiaceae bacterium]|nr:cell division protein ZapD [Burkholderiaceae bacterium]